MALACDPRLVVADEPTTALDVVSQVAVLDLLAELVTERGGVLLVTGGDRAALATACRRLVVLHAGRIVGEAVMPDEIPLQATSTDG
jgi:ABC-type dipeptide/oligopeptide/nickel transport system ATPase component